MDNLTDQQLVEFVRDHVIDCDISYRGGNLKVDASELFPQHGEQVIVGAFQNYLGGGIAGRIVGAAMIDRADLQTPDERVLFDRVLAACQQHFFEINNGGGDEHMQENYSSFAFNQNLPVSGY